MAVDDSYSKALLHFNGTDGSTTFTDESGKTWTAVGTAQLDTSEKKFGSASLLLDGDSDYIYTGDSADWYFGSGDFTIDFQLRLSGSVPEGMPWILVGQFDFGSSTYWYLALGLGGEGSDHTFTFTVMDGGSPYTYQASLSTPLSQSTWYHVAFVRNSTKFRCSVNGSLIPGGEQDSFNVPNVSGDLQVGGLDLLSVYFNGRIDELRISKGIARWTSDFTAPTAEYSAAVVPTELSISEGLTASSSFGDNIGELSETVLASMSMGLPIYESISESLTSDDTINVSVVSEVAETESATSSELLEYLYTKLGWLKTETPRFTMTGNTGINGSLSSLVTFADIKAFTGLSLSGSIPKFEINSVMRTSKSISADLLMSFFRMYATASYVEGSRFNGIGPVSTINATGYITSVASLNSNMMFPLLSASIIKDKDFSSDIIWYDKEGIVGYTKQDTPVFTAVGAAI